MAEKKKAADIAAKKASRNRLWRRIGICAGAVAAVAIVLVSYFTSSTYYRQKTAVEVGEHKLSVADFNYYYRTSYQNLYNNISETYGDYASMILDTSKPLSEQQYSETQTWEDYLTDVTLTNLSEVYAVYDEAEKNGYVLSEAGEAEIAAAVEDTRAAAKESNYKMDNYLTAVFGKGVNEKVYRSLLHIIGVYSEYTEKVQSEISFTDSEMADYYAANSREIDSVAACVNSMAYDTEETADTENAVGRTKDEVLAIAEGLLAADHSEEGYFEYLQSVMTEDELAAFVPENTRYSGLSYSSFSDTALGDWLFDEGRQTGDLGWVEGDGVYYLLYFDSRTDNDYDLVNMRHILIKPETDEDGNEAEGARDAALEKLQGIYDQWQDSSATETEFAALANTESDDGDGTTGGLYENVYQGQMVEPINSWLFEEGRVEGDCDFMETTYGWHLVYFAGYGDNYKTQRLDEAMRQNAYNEWHDAILEGHDAVTVEPGFSLTR